MIMREDIRELAQLHCDGHESVAISFYFEPRTPLDRSHREEVILVKDLVRNALREVEKEGKRGGVKADLDRILTLAENLHGNQARAKAVFACASRNFWREFDLPAQLPGTQLFVNRRFHLKPLAQVLGPQPWLWVVLVDRQKARFFDLHLGELQEREGLFRSPALREEPRHGHADYQGGQAQRRIQDDAMHHFKGIAEDLREALEKRICEKLIIGCHDSNWRQFESYLHPYVKERLVGHFSSDVSRVTNEQIREQAGDLLRESTAHRQHALVCEVLDQAKSNGRGVTGLRRVLRSLELGEVQTLLIGEGFFHTAVECNGCGHLDAHRVHYCAACGRETRELEDAVDAIIPIAIRRDIELFYVKDDPEFDSAGNIAALLRFRAGQNSGRALSVAS
jgi:peptide subunit release factor 1 (eRF1)